MKTYTCQCGNRLFFDSFECVRCQCPVGLCCECLEVVALSEENQCPHCGVTLQQCGNGPDICNAWTKVGGDSDLCRYCRLTTVIPDLAVGDNGARWKALENAKRRVLVGVEQAGFPTDRDTFVQRFPLTFELKADTEKENVSTGHADGCITINRREANPVEREKSRQRFSEPHRTLVGHFRHELGHYYWELLIRSDSAKLDGTEHREAESRLESFRELFGDERDPGYADAQKAYYENGPKPHWQSRFISAYASMHPWEDFAETFATLLDITAIVATADHFGVPHAEPSGERGFDHLFDAYRQVGVIVNELNRDMGLVDLVPEVVADAVAQKLRYVFDLTHSDRI